MAHPKRKISKTRRDKRRTHIKAKKQQIAISKATGETHLGEAKSVFKNTILVGEGETYSV